MPAVAEPPAELVETQAVRLFEPPNELPLKAGGTLGPIEVAFETYGELSPGRDNAVFVCHALTGDAHAAGRHSPTDKKPGWWDEFIGPGRGLDTDELFVVCANVLGGCMGTTGPGSENPATGEPWGLAFPFITIRDIVAVHRELLRHLEIERPLAVVGGSLGGMQVLEFASRYPDFADAAICLASAPSLTPQGIAFNAVGRRAIATDAEFRDGSYYGAAGPATGLGLARMIAHITYLSDKSIELKFGRRLQDAEQLAYAILEETEFQIESYLHYQGRRFTERFDANSYLYLTRAMDYFDLAAEHGGLKAAFAKTTARFLIASYDTDWLFSTPQSREIAAALVSLGKHVTCLEFPSPYGHDAFLIEIDQLTRVVAPFLKRTLADRRAGRLARQQEAAS